MGDHHALRNVREVGGEVVGDAVGEILLILVATQILERKHDDGEPRRGSQLVLGDGGAAEETRREARMPGVGARRDKRENERGGERRPTRTPTASPRRRRPVLSLSSVAVLSGVSHDDAMEVHAGGARTCAEMREV